MAEPLEKESNTKSSKKPRFLALILYALPVLFFIISYFLITASGEDIWQGAGNLSNGTNINPLNDAVTAFNYNSRLTDMYAWSIIDFFDYQFAFGIDTIFRLIDVAAASFTFYLTTYLIFGRKPKLLIKDALIYCASFLLLIITPFGRPFYIEFSMIHNYVPLVLVTLLITIPYYNLLVNHPPKNHLKLLSFTMLPLGIIFGMSATITPLAFLLTIVLYCLIKHRSLQRPPFWFFSGLLGTIIGFLICWFAGSGVDHYTSTSAAATFDYLPLSDIFSSIPQLLHHELYNFGITFIPLLIVSIACLLFSNHRHQFFQKSFYRSMSTSQNSISLVFSSFLIIHILGASLVIAPPRLLLPAYLAGLICTLKFFLPYLNFRLVTPVLVFFTTITILIHLSFRLSYRQTTSTILSEIKSSPSSSLCIEPSRLSPPRIPLIDLSEANLLVNWGEPMTIYQKSVTFCD